MVTDDMTDISGNNAFLNIKISRNKDGYVIGTSLICVSGV